MDNVVGIVRWTVDISSQQQSEIIRNLCGAILIEDIAEKNSDQTIRLIRRLRSSGFTTIVVQSIGRLSRQWLYLQQILIAIYKMGIRLQVIDKDTLIDVQLSVDTRPIFPVLSIDISGVDWLNEIMMPQGSLVENHRG